MAKYDELDSLLKSELMDDEEWAIFYETMGKSPDFRFHHPKRVERMNEYIRHDGYGHSIANLFRDVWSPDYKEIVRATAKKLKVTVHDHQTVDDLEGRILQEILEVAKANFIKEKGVAEWQRVEREALDEIEKLANEGKIPQADILELKGVGPGGVMALIIAGRLSGIGVYLLANKIFFAISRALGLGASVVVAGPIIGKTLALILGPAGWIFTGIWLVYEIGDTNWQRTISAVVAVALLRRRLRWKESQATLCA